jgi:hypothetical protein
MPALAPRVVHIVARLRLPLALSRNLVNTESCKDPGKGIVFLAERDFDDTVFAKNRDEKLPDPATRRPRTSAALTAATCRQRRDVHASIEKVPGPEITQT